MTQRVSASADAVERGANFSAAQTVTQGGAFKLAYSIDELAALSGVCRVKLYQEINAKRLRAQKLGRRTVIRAQDAQAWLDGLPEIQAASADAGRS
jgi:excisionase family DNA binding protein